MYNDHLKNNNKYKWLDNVKPIFDECGLSYIWRKIYFEMSSKDQFQQKWHRECFTYKIFKTEHTYGTFFDILPSAYRQKMINFRMSNNYLPIERLRRADIYDREHRKCNLCDYFPLYPLLYPFDTSLYFLYLFIYMILFLYTNPHILVYSSCHALY